MRSNELVSQNLMFDMDEGRARALRTTLTIVAVVFSFLLIASCDQATERSVETTTGPQESTSIKPVQDPMEHKGETHIVEIRQFKFFPQTLKVARGDKIIWRNLDVVPHTATLNDNAWDSGTLQRGDEWALVVDVVGEQDYICIFHPVMQGKIIVTE